MTQKLDSICNCEKLMTKEETEKMYAFYKEKEKKRILEENASCVWFLKELAMCEELEIE